MSGGFVSHFASKTEQCAPSHFPHAQYLLCRNQTEDKWIVDLTQVRAGSSPGCGDPATPEHVERILEQGVCDFAKVSFFQSADEKKPRL